MRGLLVDLEPLELEHAGVPLRTHDEAVRWIESERGNLLAIMKQAADTPSIGPEAVVALSSALLHPLGYAGLGRDQMAVHEIAYLASRRTLSPSHLAVTAFVRGGVLHAPRPEEAVEWLELAHDLWRGLGNKHGQAVALTHLGTTYGALGRHDESLTSLDASLRLLREAGDIDGESACLDHLGIANRRLGRKDEAIAAHSQAHQLSRQVGNRAGETITAANLATAFHTFGDLDAALPAYEHALDLARRNGNRQVEAECLWGLADVLIQFGRISHGLASRRESAGILLDLGWITTAELQVITTQLHPPVPPGFWTNI
jgi:tetratricopeptide (TPR) repeat protein